MYHDLQLRRFSIDYIISVLVKLDHKANEPNINTIEFTRCGVVISNILDNIEKDFGLEVMIEIVKKVNLKLNHSLGPLLTTNIQKLVKSGFKINTIHKAVELHN